MEMKMKTSDETLTEFDQFTLAYKLFMTYARMCVSVCVCVCMPNT